MRKTTVLVAVLTACSMIWATTSSAAETQNKDEHKGVTVDDLTRGLKSAGKNIENEIPKIGPAIGETFKKATGKESKKQPDEKPEKPSK
jgi:peptidoglycan hydrolase CwlO-like protein